MFCMSKKIYTASVSEHKSNHENHVTFLMAPNREGWNYLAVEKVSALLRGIRSKHHGNLYFLNHLLSFAAKSKHQSRKTVFEKRFL